MATTGKSAPKPPASQAARERYEKNGRAIDRVAKSLEAAQADLTALRGTLGGGATDLRKDLTKLLRDARRDAGKLGKAVRRDLEQVKKDLSAAAPRASRTRGSRATSAGKAPTRATSAGKAATRATSAGQSRTRVAGKSRPRAGSK